MDSMCKNSFFLFPLAILGGMIEFENGNELNRGNRGGGGGVEAIICERKF